MSSHKLFRKFTTFQLILFGFFILILTGTCLLVLPAATVSHRSASWLDALFTSVSAVCVTGLVVQDTATYWSGFGQAVILLMIQLGGLGVITVISALAAAFGRKLDLMQRSTLQDAISAPQIGDVMKITGFIIRFAFVVEVIGALLLAPVMILDFGSSRGIWYAVFHSVSAFCNAGFDLMGIRAQYSSLVSYSGNPVVNLTIMMLIAVGGFGFITWNDLLKNKCSLSRLTLQSKLILIATVILILAPFLYFYLVEFAGMKNAFWLSLFQSVTPRTAGFNTADYGSFTDTGLLITIILMLIGGAPGSTAGGMKTTTIAILALSAVATMKRRSSPSAFSRRIEKDTVHHASTLLMLYLFLLLAGGMVMSSVEGLPMMKTLFECASALGTVGLTTGITQQLSVVSRILLMIYMYFGRVGGLTLAYAMLSNRQADMQNFPSDKVMVG